MMSAFVGQSLRATASSMSLVHTLSIPILPDCVAVALYCTFVIISWSSLSASSFSDPLSSSLAFHFRLHAGPSLSLSCTGPARRPPDSAFFGEFGDLLETVATFNSQLIITGDLNVHLENSSDPAASQLQLLLDSFELVQHVTQPTHTHGGILDVIITRSDCTINELTVGPPSISDHGPVSCTLPFALPGSPVFTSRLVRGWKKLDRDKFRSAILRPVASGGARGAMAPLAPALAPPPGPSPGPPGPSPGPPGPTVGPPDLIPGPLGLGYPMKSDEIRRILPPLEFRNLIDYPPRIILPTTHESKSRKTSNPTPPPLEFANSIDYPPPLEFTNHPRK